LHGGVSPALGLLSRNNKSTRYAANLQTTQTPDSAIAHAIVEGGLSGLMGGSMASVGFLVLALAFLKKRAFLLIIPVIWLKNKFAKKTPSA
jgi:hypothetical protein